MQMFDSFSRALLEYTEKGLNGSHKIFLRCLGIESLLNGSYQIETIRVNGRVYSEIVYFEKALDQEGNL